MTLNYSLKLIFTTFTALVVAGLVFGVAEARTVVRSGEKVSVADDQTIEGDFYSAANFINVSGEVSEDLISAGGQITINGPIGGDVLLLTAKTDVHGSVGDDLRIISGEVTIADKVDGDVFVVGGVVNILSTAEITGDVLIYAGQVSIEGSIGGDVLGRIDSLRLDGPVSGLVDVTVNQLTLGDRANIEGNVTYVSDLSLVQSLNSTVGGDVVRNDPIINLNQGGRAGALVPVLVMLFSALVWYLITKKTLNLLIIRVEEKTLRSLLIGFVTFMLMPLAGVILLVSMIGGLVGTVVLVMYITVLILAFIMSPVLLGQQIMNLVYKEKSSLGLTTIVVGVLATWIAMVIPLAGPIVLFGLLLLSVGAMVDLALKHAR